MAFLASKVLGQYDLAPNGSPRLLLVAPNILHTETELSWTPHDFRLWVALHEETHRVQFTAVPWLRTHLVDSARELSQGLAPDPEELGAKLQQVARNLPEALRSGGGGLTDLFATPEQRAQIGRVTAVMSLLEGHADVVMDDVGPQVIPSVAEIRAKFQQRRLGAGTVDRCSAGCWASRPRCASTATAPSSSAPSPSGRRRRVQRRVDLPADPAAARGDLAARRVGPARPRMTGPHPAVAADPGRRARGAHRRCRRARWSSWRAAAARTPWPWPPRRRSRRRGGAAGGRAGRRPRPAGGLRRRRRPRGRLLSRPGPPPGPRPAGERARGRGGARGGRPRRPVRRPAGRRGRARGRPGAARAHPRRPGRAGPARPRPRLRRPVPGRYAAPPRRVRAPAAGPPSGHHRRGLRRHGPRPVAGPAQHGPVLPPGPRPAAAGRARARPRPRRRTALARSADLLREDADLIDGLAVRGPRARWATGSPDAAALAALPGRSGRGSGGCWPWRRGCRRARCSPCTSTRSTRWSARAGADRGRSTCRVACRRRREGGQVRIGAARPVQ